MSSGDSLIQGGQGRAMRLSQRQQMCIRGAGGGLAPSWPLIRRLVVREELVFTPQGFQHAGKYLRSGFGRCDLPTRALHRNAHKAQLRDGGRQNGVTG